MPKSDEEIRKSIKQYEKSLPDSTRNPHAKEDVESLIARASQPLPSLQGKRRRADDYTDRQTRLRKAVNTSGKRSEVPSKERFN
jgi:hypothetical protein